jgi:predicted AlkP superfamily pyrophosphatase or phosphodiesterase
MSVTDFQIQCCNLITQKLGFPGEHITPEWSAFTGNRHSYSPRVDIAIGPYSTTPGDTLEGVYNEMMWQEKTRGFMRRLYDDHVRNIHSLNIPINRFEIDVPDFPLMVSKNQNARCFLAIEIENTSTKKHIMGSLVNAASLGRVGLGIAYNESVKRTFVRILNYLAFLRRVEKNTYDTTNFLIITKEQFWNILNEFSSF